LKKYYILQISPYFNSRSGGPPYVARSLNSLFNKKGYESTLLTVDEFVANTKDVVFFKLTTRVFWYSYAFLLGSIKHIKNSEIIFIHGLYTFVSVWSSVVAFVFRKRVYILPHGMLDRDSVNSSSAVKNFIRKVFLYTIGFAQVISATKIIFNSKKEKNNSFLSKNGVVIPNGVDLNFIDHVVCEKKFFDSSKVNLFFLGRIHKIKGIELILDAINGLDEVFKKKLILIVAGSGDHAYMEFIKSKAGTNPVRFIGHIDESEKYCYLKQCDIYLQPSYTEGLSISMLEAMACGVEMITTSSVGLVDELQERSAAKIIDFDSGQLRGAIRNIISEGSGYKNRAYSLVKEKYSWDNVISEYVSLIDNSQISCC